MNFSARNGSKEEEGGGGERICLYTLHAHTRPHSHKPFLCHFACSSMDVCYTGDPIRKGDESLPYPTAFLNAYIETKGEAERRVLRANGEVC